MYMTQLPCFTPLHILVHLMLVMRYPEYIFLSLEQIYNSNINWVKIAENVLADGEMIFLHDEPFKMKWIGNE